MLPSGAHVLNLYKEILPHAAPGTVFIDSSTIDVADARAAHQLALDAGMRAIDAPVSGGTGGAAAGTLTFMCGGAAADFDAAKPHLEKMGKNIFHCGDAGAGQAAKICNNLILGISMIGVSEAFVLAEKLGLAADRLFKVASVSSGQCWSLTSYCPVPGPVLASPANRDYEGGFAAALMLKDLKLAMGAAEKVGAASGLGEVAAQLYQKFCDAGAGGKDFSAIITALRAAARA
jgi:3-hydroxyisobutyrate dehydrogenase